MDYYIGLDVSQRQTAICVVDAKGKIAVEGKALTLPSDIHGWLVAHEQDTAFAKRSESITASCQIRG
jgi:hypothetical protein